MGRMDSDGTPVHTSTGNTGLTVRKSCERNASYPGPPKDHACTGVLFLRSPVTCGAQNYVIDYHCAQKTLRLITLGSAPSPGIVPVISGPLPWIVPATGES